MADIEPTREEWLQLYAAAARLKEVAPWQWMEETDVFGVQNPETSELGFVSIMGALGEHLALALYQGAEGLYGFWGYQRTHGEVPEALLEIPRLEASFEDRNDLPPRDLQLIKDLGLRYRGRQAWPAFTSFRPGYVPWYLEAAEARFLTLAIDQALDVALRFREQRDLLKTPRDLDWLVRVPEERDGTLAWHDTVLTVPLPEPRSIQLAMDKTLLQQAQRFPHSQAVVEADLYPFPGGFGERGERPRTAYVLLLVERESGLILGTDLLQADPNLDAVWQQVPLAALRALAAFGTLPKRIDVRLDTLGRALGVLGEDLRFEVRQVRSLRALDAVKRQFMQRFGR